MKSDPAGCSAPPDGGGRRLWSSSILSVVVIQRHGQREDQLVGTNLMPNPRLTAAGYRDAVASAEGFIDWLRALLTPPPPCDDDRPVAHRFSAVRLRLTLVTSPYRRCVETTDGVARGFMSYAARNTQYQDNARDGDVDLDIQVDPHIRIDYSFGEINNAEKVGREGPATDLSAPWPLSASLVPVECGVRPAWGESNQDASRRLQGAIDAMFVCPPVFSSRTERPLFRCGDEDCLGEASNQVPRRFPTTAVTTMTSMRTPTAAVASSMCTSRRKEESDETIVEAVWVVTHGDALPASLMAAANSGGEGSAAPNAVATAVRLVKVDPLAMLVYAARSSPPLRMLLRHAGATLVGLPSRGHINGGEMTKGKGAPRLEPSSSSSSSSFSSSSSLVSSSLLVPFWTSRRPTWMDIAAVEKVIDDENSDRLHFVVLEWEGRFHIMTAALRTFLGERNTGMSWMSAVFTLIYLAVRIGFAWVQTFVGQINQPRRQQPLSPAPAAWPRCWHESLKPLVGDCVAMVVSCVARFDTASGYHYSSVAGDGGGRERVTTSRCCDMLTKVAARWSRREAPKRPRSPPEMV